MLVFQKKKKNTPIRHGNKNAETTLIFFLCFWFLKLKNWKEFSLHMQKLTMQTCFSSSIILSVKTKHSFEIN